MCLISRASTNHILAYSRVSSPARLKVVKVSHRGMQMCSVAFLALPPSSPTSVLVKERPIEMHHQPDALVNRFRDVWLCVSKCHYCMNLWAETKSSCAPKTRDFLRWLCSNSLCSPASPFKQFGAPNAQFHSCKRVLHSPIGEWRNEWEDLGCRGKAACSGD